jgi:tRNA-binding EMAP/Myf-like protein
MSDAAPFHPAPVKPTVDAALLDQLDVRAGTIRAAVPVDGTERLVLLTVSFGDHERTIVAVGSCKLEVEFWVL